MKVSAVVPAFNEAPRIGDVIRPLISSGLVEQVIVVDDGSEDGTANVARECGAEVLVLEKNEGKGGAVLSGMAKVRGEVLLLMDADLVGLKDYHIKAFIDPIVNDEADMTVGIFEDGRFFTDLAQNMSPHLSGQRAMKISSLKDLDQLDASEFGLEVALTKYAKDHDFRVKKVPLENLSQVMKEEKIGTMKGFAYRMKMYYDILKTLVKNMSM